MGIVIKLDRIMVEKKVSLNSLAEDVGITTANMSNIKTGKAKAIRFSTLEKICKTLKCQPGDILEYTEEDANELL